MKEDKKRGQRVKHTSLPLPKERKAQLHVRIPEGNMTLGPAVGGEAEHEVKKEGTVAISITHHQVLGKEGSQEREQQ